MGREARANAATADTIEKFLFAIPITKRNADTWEVEGIATSETVDKQGEIIDYESAKKFFNDETMWPGNIRQQHDADKPVGKRVSIACDDATKSITLRARVSKACPDTWQLVEDGVLCAFSIGGSGARKVEKVGDRDVTRVVLKSLFEVSLVDNPANPDAHFDMVKSVDGALIDVMAADPVAPVVAKTTDILDAAIASGKAAAEAAPKYAGVDGKSIPIKTVEDVRKALGGLAALPGAERMTVRANIVAIASADDTLKAALSAGPARRVAIIGDGFTGRVAKMLGEAGRARVELVVKAGMEPWDIDSALAIISMLERLMSSEYWDARYAATTGDVGAQVAEVLLLKQAAGLVMQFLLSEFNEQFSADPIADVPAIDLSGDSVVEMFAKSLAVVQKAGARHSKSDVEMIQKVHDLSNSLGGTCSTDNVDKAALKVVALDTADAYAVDLMQGDKVIVKNLAVIDAAGKPVAKLIAVVSDADAVSKLTTKLEGSQADVVKLVESVEKLTGTLAEQAKRIEKFESSPAVVGPVKNASAVVEKTVGGPAGEQADGKMTPASLQAAIAAVVKDCSPETRHEVAAQMIKMSRRVGQIDTSAVENAAQ